MALRIAIFGQAQFGKDVVVRLADAGHRIVAVYAPPDRGGRPDPLAAEAGARGIRLLRPARLRRQGVAIPELVAEHASLGADLNVLPYTTVIIPLEILDAPQLGSLCFHPSLLPRFRGGAAIPWQIMLGESVTGVSVFRPDAGVDTGPIVVQRGGVEIGATDTAATLYFSKLYPLGVDAVVEAVDAVGRGAAKPVAQDESKATFQGLVDDAVARLDFSKPAVELDRWIRGCDPQPGAHARKGDVIVRLFDGRLLAGDAPEAPGTLVAWDGDAAVIAARGGRLRVGRVRAGQDGKKVPPREAGLEVGDRLA
jgi:methionyl-tRNA formyltransferase